METAKRYDLLIEKYGYNNPILLRDLYDDFSNANKGTIREYIRRNIVNKKFIKLKNGVYALPRANTVLKKVAINADDTINKLYIFDKHGSRTGYRSGFHIANALRLTTQNPSVTTIYSNSVSKKKRTIVVQNSRLIINQARVIVNDENYKLLQVLDLLINLKKYSEITFGETKKIIRDYLYNVRLSKQEIEMIVAGYPKVAQIQLYKMEIINEITRGQRLI